MPNGWAQLSAEVADRLLLVMRVYFEKPRTTVGWKGLIMDPHLDNTSDIATGLRQARRFLCEVLELGVPTATELLDPITPQYIADLICWSAIGARTTESQTHRQMASGLSMPLGFKNATSGSLAAAVNAIKAATQPQTFLGVDREGVASSVSTRGNPHCHIILRGGSNGPNYDAESVSTALTQLEKNKLSQAIMIDASHDNSKKDHRLQPEVFRQVIEQRVAGNEWIVAGMLESNLEAGNQSLVHPLSDLRYGQSITDKCIDWDTTVTVVKEAYDQLGFVTMSDTSAHSQTNDQLEAAIRNPQNVGEMENADAVGTVGSPDCGDMLRMWVKFREEDGKKVIDKATFQSFGCQTAIAVASVATEMIKGKTVDEALALESSELSESLGPLPPMKIHCGQLVESALKDALSPGAGEEAANTPPQTGGAAMGPSLVDAIPSSAGPARGTIKIVPLDPDPEENP